MSESQPLSRCSIGLPLKETTPLTVSEQRRHIPVAWARTSTQPGRLHKAHIANADKCNISVKWRMFAVCWGFMVHLRVTDADIYLCVLWAQNREWNEELQGCKELPRSSLQERLHRERILFKVRPHLLYNPCSDSWKEKQTDCKSISFNTWNSIQLYRMKKID